MTSIDQDTRRLGQFLPVTRMDTPFSPFLDVWDSVARASDYPFCAFLKFLCLNHPLQVFLSLTLSFVFDSRPIIGVNCAIVQGGQHR